MEKIEQLQQMLDQSRHVVFFGGAGVSTESGIPDFRSTDGLYHQKYPYPPETMLSHTFYQQHPEEFFTFYRDKMLYPNAKPNAAHKKLAELEQAGKLTAVVTQNIDGLHQAAGSKKVFELHGSVLRNYCESCRKFYPLEAILHSSGVPRCSCGGIITPGFIALQIGNPLSIAMALASAVVLSFVLEGVVRITGIYGRQRIALAMLLALGCKFMLDLFFPVSSLWLGWVLPGLVAADWNSYCKFAYGDVS